MPADVAQAEAEQASHLLDPERVPDHIDALYRAALAMCRSRQDAEDLVQETLANVLQRPRWILSSNELGYLLRALRHTHLNRLRMAARRPVTIELLEHDIAVSDDAALSRDLMEAIASAPAPYRDAVIAVDLLGLSYREAARSLRTREATITSRLHRGRQHIAQALLSDPATLSRAGR